ncbi:MAG: universal stress protein [Pseudotabrizicola sp.]|uniref:universal stress protein n=1 Tax=Pseudotabrizicola sp. TaxID=2939647 RepID=UPI0027256F88|nr:universal stress protein [Pseudotabrizicola sp.]MDO8882749.1 universal stress protein [Pseudotabrizicola sp.]MDP2082251.1 universal stress protein [Pseudotabrizicola sp.]MDZ7575171.1 universal stress protein [Pseudotabrizicola sp.]
MTYKTIFTVATQAEHVPLTIAAAARFCAQNDAHLDVLALGVDRTQMGYSYIGTGAVLLQVAQERADNDARALEAAVKAAVAAEGPGLRVSTEAAVTQIGAITEIVAQRARFADLVILARPYGTDQGIEAEAVVESALFEGRAPVLVLPESGLATATPKRVIVAWNQGREAMAAVRAALPLLKQAEQVTITVVDPPVHGPERSDPGGMLCQMLVRHGVHAEVSVLARTLPRVSDVLLRHVRDRDADLLVMGAYGHSRFRQAILGGATRNMLEQATVPVLMAH